MFNICQANFKSAHLLNKMALIQFQSNRTVGIFKRKSVCFLQYQLSGFHFFEINKIESY